MSNWIEFYLYFCTITAIFSLYKLYIPCWKQIKKETDKEAKRIQSRPIITGIVFSLTAFTLAPLFFVLTIMDLHTENFIKGFVKGRLG
jgi:hypothetical protein